MAWYAGDSGDRLWYEDHGAGTPIVFIHGWCMSSAVWRLQLEGLSDTFRVITIDLPGHGKSLPPAGGFHTRPEANFLFSAPGVGLICSFHKVRILTFGLARTQQYRFTDDELTKRKVFSTLDPFRPKKKRLKRF